MKKAPAGPAGELAKAIARWQVEPQTMVRELLGAEPDLWQDEVLACFPTTPADSDAGGERFGQSCLLSWLGLELSADSAAPAHRRNLDHRGNRQLLGVMPFHASPAGMAGRL
jgi:hypothetical protein